MTTPAPASASRARYFSPVAQPAARRTTQTAPLSAWVLALGLGVACWNVSAQPARSVGAAPPASSPLDGELFYQLILGELQLTAGEPGAAYSLMLDAAKKSRLPELFRRAIDIALQGRSGPAALTAAQEWAKAAPQSEDPPRYSLQILLALNRAQETVAPLRALLQNASPEQRLELIKALPTILGRVADKGVALQVGQEVLQKALRQPATATVASATIGRLQQEYGRYLSLQKPPQHDDAQRMFVLATERLPGDPDVVYEHAMAAERAGQFARTEQLLRGLMAEHPTYHHAFNALGYSLADRNERLHEARTLIEQALRMAPEDPYIMDSLGWVEFRLGWLEQAAQTLAKAFDLKPDAEIAAHLGEVLWTLGDTERARQVWNAGMQLNAENETLINTLRRLQVTP